MEQSGFFVKLDHTYQGPFETLNQARSEARKHGRNIPIMHGTLKRISEDIFDDSKLFIVPKILKGAATNDND